MGVDERLQRLAWRRPTAERGHRAGEHTRRRVQQAAQQGGECRLALHGVERGRGGGGDELLPVVEACDHGRRSRDGSDQAGRDHRLVAHLRVRRGVNRWRHLTLAFYSNAWIAWWRKRRRKHALMARIAEPLARRAARALRCAFEALLVSNPQGDARARRGAALESEQERRARLFLASHAFVATPAQAFLAGLSAPMELVCGRPDDPPVPSNSLLAYVKARPLADAGPAGPACLAAAPARRPAAVERVLGRARGGHAVPPPLAAALVGRPGDAGRAATRAAFSCEPRVCVTSANALASDKLWISS